MVCGVVMMTWKYGYLQGVDLINSMCYERHNNHHLMVTTGDFRLLFEIYLEPSDG